MILEALGGVLSALAVIGADYMANVAVRRIPIDLIQLKLASRASIGIVLAMLLGKADSRLANGFVAGFIGINVLNLLVLIYEIQELFGKLAPMPLYSIGSLSTARKIAELSRA